METKNIIICNYANTLSVTVHTVIDTANTLRDNMDENRATLKTLNVLLESIRSQTVNIQNAIDSYND